MPGQRGCLIQTQDVSRGPQLVSTAKLHLAVETPSGVKHTSARFIGTRQWQREGFTADVPSDARRVVLNVGLEACSGRMRLANCWWRTDRLGVRPLRWRAWPTPSTLSSGCERFPAAVSSGTRSLSNPDCGSE